MHKVPGQGVGVNPREASQAENRLSYFAAIDSRSPESRGGLEHIAPTVQAVVGAILLRAARLGGDA